VANGRVQTQPIVDLLRFLFTWMLYHAEMHDTWHCYTHDILSHPEHNHDAIVPLVRVVRRAATSASVNQLKSRKMGLVVASNGEGGLSKSSSLVSQCVITQRYIV
jgi:hypothetical protein